MKNKLQTNRVPSYRFQGADSGKFRVPNRFQSLSTEPEDYEKSFPPLSGSSSKSRRFLSSQEQLFIDAAEVNTCLLRMANDLPLDLRSRNFASNLVKIFEEHVKEASTDLESRVSLEDRVDCLLGLSPIQIAEGLKLNFRPLTSPRAAVPTSSGQQSVIQSEAKEKTNTDKKRGIVSFPRGDLVAPSSSSVIEGPKVKEKLSDQPKFSGDMISTKSEVPIMADGGKEGARTGTVVVSEGNKTENEVPVAAIRDSVPAVETVENEDNEGDSGDENSESSEEDASSEEQDSEIGEEAEAKQTLKLSSPAVRDEVLCSDFVLSAPVLYQIYVIPCLVNEEKKSESGLANTVKQIVVNGGEYVQARQVFDKKPEGGPMAGKPSDDKGCVADVGAVELDAETGDVETEFNNESMPNVLQNGRSNIPLAPTRYVIDEMTQRSLEASSEAAVTVCSLLDDSAMRFNSKYMDGGCRPRTGEEKDCLDNAHKETNILPQRRSEVNLGARQPHTWANVVAPLKPGGSRLNHRSDSGSILEYLAPMIPGIIDIEDNLVNEQPWQSCLVGYFLDADFAFGRVRATAMSLWKNEGLVEVHDNDSGIFFFKFRSLQEMDNVMEKGPWHFYGKLLILRKWRKRLRLSKEAFSKVPIWVKFLGLPLEFWNDACLSRIASAIGVPLFLDKATDSKLCISYARICIEVDASKPLTHSVVVRCEGEAVEIPVVYQGLPPMCGNCKAFGHAPGRCKEKKLESVFGHLAQPPKPLCASMQLKVWGG
ncbi:hypothetical protein U1Q18_007573 [Sarracenia purpurea var. burkii]